MNLMRWLPVVGMAAILPAGVCRLSADEWPQWRGPNRDGTWHETGLIDKFSEPEIELRWKVDISSGYSGPTVGGGRVFVTDRVVEPEMIERVHAFDWETGHTAWTFSYECPYFKVGYPAGPRASVAIDDGCAYALGTMGHLFCLDAATGDVLWKKLPGVDYRINLPIWGIAASPLIDGNLLIVQMGASEEGACLVALDKRTGAEKWRALNDRASYSAPIIINQAGRRVLLAWTGDNVVGLDPASGQTHWKYPFKPAKMVINVPTPVTDGRRIFLTAFYDGSLMLRLDPNRLAVEKLWRRQGLSERNTDALHAMISTPYFKGDHLYGVDSYGELRCLDATSGDRLWEDLTATPRNRWSNIHMVQNAGRSWLFNERGELVIATLDPDGFHEISRAKLIEPTTDQLSRRDGVCWSHPAYAHRHIFARNDDHLVAASLAAE